MIYFQEYTTIVLTKNKQETVKKHQSLQSFWKTPGLRLKEASYFWDDPTLGEDKISDEVAITTININTCRLFVWVHAGKEEFYFGGKESMILKL